MIPLYDIIVLLFLEGFFPAGDLLLLLLLLLPLLLQVILFLLVLLSRKVLLSRNHFALGVRAWALTFVVTFRLFGCFGTLRLRFFEVLFELFDFCIFRYFLTFR